MYGKTAIDFPRRVVCLTSETAEIAHLVGAGDRVVGVPGTARRPDAARDKAKVGGFTAEFVDQRSSLAPHLPAALAIVALGTLLVLFLMTGSIVLPLKSLVMNGSPHELGVDGGSMLIPPAQR